jgi:hypothetical protein
MTPLRPIGHIAASLPILAVAIAYRLRLANDALQYVCWVDDDGCIYLAVTRHPRANAMLRHAAEQRVNTYRKPRKAAFPLTASDIVDDLKAAQTAHAYRTMHQAMQAAA